jgi:ATP-binding cassette subfamily F protein 3
VLLDALEDYGGTLIFVSHDRYFVEKLATKIIEVGHGKVTVYPGTYAEFLWSKEHQEENPKAQTPKPKSQSPNPKSEKAPGAKANPESRVPNPGPTVPAPPSREDRKRLDAERKKLQKSSDALKKRIVELESRIAQREAEVKEIEAAMASPGFYDNLEAAKPLTDRHQALMWEVGDLIGQWEALQAHASEPHSET